MFCKRLTHVTALSALMLLPIPLLAAPEAATSAGNGVQTLESYPGIEFVPATRTKDGCVGYTKRATDPSLVVDSAIWFFDSEQTAQASPKNCAPNALEQEHE